jgi:ketosteroid isomerase-like protein
MRAILVVLLVATLAAVSCTPAPAPPAKTAASGAEDAVQEVKAQVQKTMNAFAATDLEGFKAGLREDVVSFEFDMEGKPVRLGSREEALQFAQDIWAALQEMGATIQLETHSTECRAGTRLAYCTVEFDFNAVMADGSVMTQPTRNSVVLQSDEGGWRWVHWHSSPAAAPPPPAP